MNVYLPNLRLPSEYQEVEWIGRNGNNYIDTLWIPKQTVGFTIKIGYKISQSGGRHCILSNYGTVSGLPSNYQGAISLETNASNAARFFTTSGTQGVEFTSSNTLSTSDFYDIVFSTSGNSSGTIEVNSTTTTGSIYTGTYYNCSGWLFVDRNSRYSTFYNSYISYCKIYEAGTLVRDFVPCYRKSDSVIGLYDLVNNQFYTNSGTGTFSKGNDVTMAVLKNAYIGEYITQTFNFQTDGALGWTDSPLGYGNCSIVSGQGWQITKSSGSQDKQGGIMPPSSVYKGTLKKYKIWFYKNLRAASGIGNSSQNYLIEYGRSGTNLIVRSPSASTIATISLTGEIIMEMIFEDNGHITIKLTNNGTTNTYDGGAVASTFQDLWDNNNLGVMLGEWAEEQTGSKVYIRKVEIESA